MAAGDDPRSPDEAGRAGGVERYTPKPLRYCTIGGTLRAHSGWAPWVAAKPSDVVPFFFRTGESRSLRASRSIKIMGGTHFAVVLLQVLGPLQCGQVRGRGSGRGSGGRVGDGRLPLKPQRSQFACWHIFTEAGKGRLRMYSTMYQPSMAVVAAARWAKAPTRSMGLMLLGYLRYAAVGYWVPERRVPRKLQSWYSFRRGSGGGGGGGGVQH